MFVFRFMLWLYKICFQVAWWLLKVMVKSDICNRRSYMLRYNLSYMFAVEKTIAPIA